MHGVRCKNTTAALELLGHGVENSANGSDSNRAVQETRTCKAQQIEISALDRGGITLVSKVRGGYIKSQREVEEEKKESLGFH